VINFKLEYGGNSMAEIQPYQYQCLTGALGLYRGLTAVSVYVRHGWIG